jgi:glucan 1,3-beta-glucosidase
MVVAIRSFIFLTLPALGACTKFQTPFRFTKGTNITTENVEYSPNVTEFYKFKSLGLQLQFQLPVDPPWYSNGSTADIDERNDARVRDYGSYTEDDEDEWEVFAEYFDADVYDSDDEVDSDADVKDEEIEEDEDDDETKEQQPKAEDNTPIEESSDEDDEASEEDEQLDEDTPSNSEPATSGKFDYRTQKINGINLGGWLVTEPFISPSLYEQASVGGNEAGTPVDEYSLCRSLGQTVAYERLKKHWDTWVTEADIAQIKAFGFNAVRLPIGYWAFARLPTDPYVFGQEEYLQKTIEWCRIHGLKLWIDLHGIPGSQNGFDNSGQRDVYMWMDPQINFDLGIHVLQYIFDKYGGPEYADVIIGYENLNEPLHNRYPIPNIIDFDQTTYKMFREKSTNWFVYHDAFLPAGFWNTVLNEPDYVDTVLDHHRYEVFDTTQLRESTDGHITSMKLLVQDWLKLPKIQIVGEWSAALTDCCKWLNGVGRGARYDNTFSGNGVIGQCRFSNDHSKMTDTDKINTRRIIEAQLDLYNQTNGFFFWTYKTESAIEWSMKDLAALGLFPQPLSNRKFARVSV